MCLIAEIKNIKKYKKTIANHDYNQQYRGREKVSTDQVK
jgi:hypothetical protein